MAEMIIVGERSDPGARSALHVAKIESFFDGARVVRLEDLPLRQRVSTPGGTVSHIESNVRPY